MILNVFIYIMYIYTVHSMYMLYSVPKFSIFLRRVTFLHWIESPDSSFFDLRHCQIPRFKRPPMTGVDCENPQRVSFPFPQKNNQMIPSVQCYKETAASAKWKKYAFWTCPFRNIFVCRFRRPFFPTGDAVDADESRWSATEVADGWMEDVYRGPSQNGSMKNRILPIGSLPSHISRHNSCWLNKLWCCSRCKCNFGPARVCLKRELLVGRNCDVLHVED